MLRPPPHAILACAFALLLGGCGQSPRDEARSAVEDFVAAVGDGELEDACDQLEPDAADGLVSLVLVDQAGNSVTTCAGAIASLVEEKGSPSAKSGDAKVEKVEVQGRLAMVTTPEGTLSLERLDGDFAMTSAEQVARELGGP